MSSAAVSMIILLWTSSLIFWSKMEEAVLVNVTTLDFPFSSVMISSSPKCFWSYPFIFGWLRITTGILFIYFLFCWLGHWQWFVHCHHHKQKSNLFKGISFPLIFWPPRDYSFLILVWGKGLWRQSFPASKVKGCMFDDKQHQQLASHGQTQV